MQMHTPGLPTDRVIQSYVPFPSLCCTPPSSPHSAAQLCQDPPLAFSCNDALIVQEVVQGAVFAPLLRIVRLLVVLLRRLPVLADVLQSLIPRVGASEFGVADEALALRGWFADGHEASDRDCVHFAILRIVLRRTRGRLVLRCLLGFQRVHASNVLNEEIFAVEVVGLTLVLVALVTSPETSLHVLRVDVPLPFVFGTESRGAAVDRERTRERSVRS